MSALAEVAAAGGRVWAEGERLHYRLPKGRADLIETLREHKPELMTELRRRTLLDHCKEACRNLSLCPEELLASLDESDKAATLSGDPAELKALRCFAESLALRLRTNEPPSGISEAYERLRAELKRWPEKRTAAEVLGPDADSVLLAVAIRSKGCVTLRIARERYDDAQVLEILDRRY